MEKTFFGELHIKLFVSVLLSMATLYFLSRLTAGQLEGIAERALPGALLWFGVFGLLEMNTSEKGR